MSNLNRNAQTLGEIANLCYLITNETKYDAWFEYHAHVNQITVRVHLEGDFLSEPSFKFDDYLQDKRVGPYDRDLGHDTRPKFLRLKRDLTAFLKKARNE